LIGNSQIFIGDPRFLMVTFRLSFVSDPQIFIGDRTKFIGDPKYSFYTFSFFIGES